MEEEHALNFQLEMNPFFEEREREERREEREKKERKREERERKDFHPQSEYHFLKE